MRRTMFLLLLSLLALSCGQDMLPTAEISGPHGSAQGREYTDGERMSMIERLLDPGMGQVYQWVFQQFPGQDYWLSYSIHFPAQVWFWQGSDVRDVLDQALDEFGIHGTGCLADTLRISRLDILPSLCDQYYAEMYWHEYAYEVKNLCFDMYGHAYWFQKPKARACINMLETLKVFR